MRDSARSGVLLRLAASATLALGVGLLLSLDDSGEPRAQAPQAASPTVPVLPPPPFTPGMPFTEPPVVKSHGMRLRTTLVARNGSVDISGVTVAETQTYAARGADGASRRSFLGPTLRVRPGDWIELTLDNRLTVPDGAQGADCPVSGHAATREPGRRAQAGTAQLTNLHYHGLHVTPRERSPYGDSVLVDLPKGKSRFRFRIPPTHDRGTFWYHAHLHGCTDDQVFRGLAGLLLVGDSRRDLPRRFRAVRTRSLALKDVQVESADSGGWRITDDHDWTNGTHRTVNGLVDPDIRIRPGETQLWRLGNLSSAVWYKVALVDESNGARDPLTVVAQDGNSLRRAVSRPWLVIPPGRRFDVLVRGPDSGERVLKTLAFDQGRRTFPEDTLATVRVDGAPAPAIAAPRRLAADAQRFPRRRGRSAASRSTSTSGHRARTPRCSRSTMGCSTRT